MLAPSSVAIVGLSDDPSKHGGRVLANLRKLGYPGTVVGVNPRRPDIEGVEVVADLGDLPEPADLVVSAVPAGVTPSVVASAGGSGGVVVFAGGFTEAGPAGARLQAHLIEAARSADVPVLGPNSGGIIRPVARLAASFLTCLDRPTDQIRSGPVGLVTQSGGTGSYVHNLAAAAGSGLAASISTGNEAVVGVPDGIEVLCELSEVRVIALVVETVRDGEAFTAALEAAHRAGKPVVACRIGTSARGSSLMGTHTGAMAVPAKVLDGVFDAFGVISTETPEEMLAVADVLGHCGAIAGDRLGVVTHSGGIAILLTDLAERTGVALPHPSAKLVGELEPLLHQGSSDNPLDMGGIIGGPGRFAEVVDRFARSGDFDCVLAVSTAHPPAHTVERVAGLLELESTVPVVHLWMAGDVGAEGEEMLRAAERPVVTEPRAAMKAMAALLNPVWHPRSGMPAEREAAQQPSTEHEAKLLAAAWGLPVVDGGLATTADEAADVVERLDAPVAMKTSAPGLLHKTDIGGVRLRIEGAEAARRVFEELIAAGRVHDLDVDGVRIERMASGFEVIVGLTRDLVFGPVVVVGPGGLGAEGMGLERLAPAPLDVDAARRLIGRVPGLGVALDRLDPDAAPALAELVSLASSRFAHTGLTALEMNPVAWSDDTWKVLDVVMISSETEGEAHGATR